MRHLIFGRPAIRYALGLALCAYALIGEFSFTGYALQSRSITEGVYSAAQAARGKQIYEARCAGCHGNAMEGSVGPPLVGDGFLSNWSARPLAELVDKTQKTMPFESPGSLSREQSTDLTAYMLQVGRFPAGQTELSSAILAEITMPTVRTAPAAALTVGGPALLPPTGNLAELMRAIQFPNSNIIFNVQVKDPGTQLKKENSTLDFDYVEWGSTIYPGWLAVDQAALAIVETAPLLMTPARRCQNGRAVPVDRADWKQYVDGMVEAGMLARRASLARNFEAFGEVSEKLNTSCANCHMVYRDAGGTEGSGTGRCQ